MNMLETIEKTESLGKEIEDMENQMRILGIKNIVKILNSLDGSQNKWK